MKVFAGLLLVAFLVALAGCASIEVVPTGAIYYTEYLTLFCGGHTYTVEMPQTTNHGNLYIIKCVYGDGKVIVVPRVEWYRITNLETMTVVDEGG